VIGLILLLTLLPILSSGIWIRKANARKSGRAPKERISLLVPFRADYPERGINWAWLHEYWAHALPDAEIIVGQNDATPFCKTAAVNDAFSRSTGDIIVLLDADCYIDPNTITELAARIRAARSERKKLWYIPYRRFYRLSEIATQALLSSDPHDPLTFSDPPPDVDLDTNFGTSQGHWYGALIQMMPREAFIAAGGMDTRFTGWGGEDISFMYAVDTMYARHRTFDGPTYHVWHPTIKGVWKATRQWIGQEKPESNDWLSGRYTTAVGDKVMMQDLIAGINDED
jgi:hypothetical protein